MLEKRIVYEHFIGVLGDIRERERTEILEDGNTISMAYTNSQVVCPSDSLEGRQERTKKIAQAIWTPEVVAAYKAMIADTEKNTKTGD